MDKLEIGHSSQQRVLYAALVEGLMRNCPKKPASEMGNEIAFEEVAELARRIGTRPFLGRNSERVVRRGRLQASRWPRQRDGYVSCECLGW